jgi:hypothetical protein
MRRTLWVATPEVTRRIHAAATRRLFAVEHRRTAKLLAESGVADPEAWLREARDQVLAGAFRSLLARGLVELGPEPGELYATGALSTLLNVRTAPN